MPGYNLAVEVKMPYIPRSLAPMSYIEPKSVPKAPVSKTKPAVPLNIPDSKIYSRKNNPLMSKLSMGTWDVDPLKIYKQLTQKDLNVDEHSGLVSNT